MSPDVSVVLPCRNEEAALKACLTQIKTVFLEHSIKGEIVVADSSTDTSPAIARAASVRLVQHTRDGYGAAYQEGFKAAQGKYLFGADPDGSYDFRELPRFIAELDAGADFVIGNRLKGQVESGAMPWLHRYIGTPVLSWLTRLLFGLKVGDSQCGMRAWRRDALESINATTPGMEYASEMIVKAQQQGLRIVELPIDYAARQGASKLNTWRDGWRHLWLLLRLRFSP